MTHRPTAAVRARLPARWQPSSRRARSPLRQRHRARSRPPNAAPGPRSRSSRCPTSLLASRPHPGCPRSPALVVPRNFADPVHGSDRPEASIGPRGPCCDGRPGGRGSARGRAAYRRPLARRPSGAVPQRRAGRRSPGWPTPRQQPRSRPGSARRPPAGDAACAGFAPHRGKPERGRSGRPGCVGPSRVPISRRPPVSGAWPRPLVRQVSASRRSQVRTLRSPRRSSMAAASDGQARNTSSWTAIRTSSSPVASGDGDEEAAGVGPAAVTFGPSWRPFRPRRLLSYAGHA